MLDRKIIEKMNKLSRMYGIETPLELHTRYVNELDQVIKSLISLQEEFIISTQAIKEQMNFEKE